MKTIDKIKLAIIELGPDWSRKELRAKFSETEISNAVLDNALNRIKKSNHFPHIYIDEENGELSSSFHVLPVHVRNLCIDMFGPTWGRLLAYILSCHTEDIVVDQKVLGSCHVHGYTALMLGKTPNYKDLAAEIYEKHFTDCPFNVNISDYVAEKCARMVENFECPDEILEALENACTSLVDVFTGRPASLQMDESEQSTVEPVEGLRNRLLSQGLDYKALVKTNLSNAMGMIGGLENIRERVKQYAILNKIVINPQPHYSAVTKSVRLYAKGASFQCLSRDIRKSFFSGKRQFDLKHAQLVIISKLWDAPEILEYFGSKSVWSTLMSETKLDKDSIKRGVYTLIFGGSYANAVMNMAEVSEMPLWKVKDCMARCKFFKVLENASRRFSAKIKADKSVKDAFGRELVDKDKLSAKDIRSIKGLQAQSYEVAIMIPVIEHLLDKGFNCWLFLHDGFISDDSSYMLYQELKAIAEYAGKQFGMTMSLDMETLD